MSRIDEQSPKHCAKKGCHLNFLNKKLLKILSTIMLSIISLFFLIWFTLHPSKPHFTLNKIDVNQLNFSSIDVVLESQNPNQRVGIYYDELQAHATYKRQQITQDTSIPTFYQGQQESLPLSASLIGNGLSITPSLGYEVARDQAAGNLMLTVKIDGKIRWKVASWVSGQYKINVECMAILPLGAFNPTSPASSKQGTQCSTNMK